MKPNQTPRITITPTPAVHLTDTEPDRWLCLMTHIDPDDPEGKEKVSMLPRRHGGRDTTTKIL